MRKSAWSLLAAGMLLKTLRGSFSQGPLCEGLRERCDFLSDQGKPCFPGTLGLFLCYRCCLFNAATRRAESQMQTLVTTEL